MNKIKKRFLILLAILAFLILCGFIAMNAVVGSANSTMINELDLKGVSDGVYTGEYSIGPVEASVEVTVKSQRIEDIQILKHMNGLGASAERIVKDVTASQSVKVDAVSGATVSSKCILKAIENAFKNKAA